MLRGTYRVARTLIGSFCPIQMLSQTLRIQIFHPLCSNRVQSDKRIQYLQPDRKSAGVASVEETRAYPCPRLARVRADQPDGRVSWSYAIYIYITACSSPAQAARLPERCQLRQASP